MAIGSLRSMTFQKGLRDRLRFHSRMGTSCTPPFTTMFTVTACVLSRVLIVAEVALAPESRCS
jgi:hypothetical protein